MKDFEKFARFLLNNQIKFYGTSLQKKSSYENKIDKLINGITSGTYANDTEAAWDLYKSKATNKNYQMLKSRIKEQLISYVFLMDLKKFSHSYTSKVVFSSKYLMAGQLMLNMGLSEDGEDLVKEGLALALSGQASGLIVFGARLMRSRLSFTGSKEEFLRYSKLVKENLKVYEAELEADEMYNDLKIDLRKSFAPLNKEKTLKYWRRINCLNNTYDNHFLKIMHALLGSNYYESIGDFKGIIKICDQAEQYLLRNPKFYDLPKHRAFAIIKVEASILLKDYELGVKNAETCMKLFNKFNINSLVAMENYVLLCMHTKKYDKAWKLYDDATTDVLFKDYPPERYDKWKIFEAYLNFIHPKSGSKFKVNKFLNEVPVYSKDKRGINIAIIIAQIILLVDDGNFEVLIDKTDAFKAYFRRYVNKSINYRTYYFVKMLLVMFNSTFNYKRTEEESKQFFKCLGDKEGHYKGDIESLEIIPYENLWPEVLNRLKKHEFSFQEPVVSYTRKKKLG